MYASPLLILCVQILSSTHVRWYQIPSDVSFFHLSFSFSIVEVRIVRVFVDVNIVIVLVGLLLIGLFPIGQSRGTWLLIICSTASYNGFSNSSNPIIFGNLTVGVQQDLCFGSRNFQRMALLGLQIGRFHRGTRCQINHTVRTRILIVLLYKSRGTRM